MAKLSKAEFLARMAAGRAKKAKGKGKKAAPKKSKVPVTPMMPGMLPKGMMK